MRFLPKETLVYHSTLKADQLHERLSIYVEPRLDGLIDWKKKREKPYEGLVKKDGFEISRIIDYRNSFLPVVSGKITPSTDQSVVVVTMALHSFVRIFLAIWFAMAILFFFVYLVKSIKDTTIDPILLIPITLVALGYRLTIRAFKVESDRAREDLKEMLSATL